MAVNEKKRRPYVTSPKCWLLIGCSNRCPSTPILSLLETLTHLLVRSSNATEMLRELKGYGVQFNNKNKDGLMPLHIVTDPSVVRMLLELGAGVNFRIEKRETVLHTASANGSLEVVRVLVQCGAGINIQDHSDNTALMAASNISNSIVTYLLYSGADLTLKNKRGRTALHYAVKGGCIE
ncbi:26S proteasome non-ATPase regulatory subunit 10-like [Halyomorpha halys]|uniref:26S proteasome non-ATPase regulatory subunit 10-like n=1 Tax=Halyomorpha halys TaxID=286706 RepID=UPI0006D52030|nr:uncharacterized protein LOC106688509 [Halyomorpha halys]